MSRVSSDAGDDPRICRGASAASGEADRLLQAHTGFFLALVEAAELEWGGPWTGRLASDASRRRSTTCEPILRRSLILPGGAEMRFAHRLPAPTILVGEPCRARGVTGSIRR